MHSLLRAEGLRLRDPRGHCTDRRLSLHKSGGVPAALSVRLPALASLSQAAPQAVPLPARRRLLGAHGKAAAVQFVPLLARDTGDRRRTPQDCDLLPRDQPRPLGESDAGAAGFRRGAAGIRQPLCARALEKAPTEPQIKKPGRKLSGFFTRSFIAINLRSLSCREKFCGQCNTGSARKRSAATLSRSTSSPSSAPGPRR